MGELLHENEHRPLKVGRSLFDEADELALRVPSSCRRTGRCRECVVQVTEGDEALSPPGEAEAFLPSGFRLACQAVVERTDRNVRFTILRRRLRIRRPRPLPAARPRPSLRVCGSSNSLKLLVCVEPRRARNLHRPRTGMPTLECRLGCKVARALPIPHCEESSSGRRRSLPRPPACRRVAPEWSGA